MIKLIANRYQLLKHIGQGGMADVYVALDTLLNREVAIKILRGDLASDPLALLRFQREAKASCSLVHPNIVEIFDVGEDNSRYFIVMEYIKGKTLKQLISIRGGLTVGESVSIMKQIVSATNEAHCKSIIHRDLKPQNIIVNDDGSIKILDFGIALAHDALQLTQGDSVMGSVHYLAPELARGESASYQSDIYSLGIVFYELLTGQVPFSGEALVQVALKHMRDEIPAVKNVIIKCPQSIDNIIIRATAKNKAFRYNNCVEMYKDLQTCQEISRANEPKVIFEVNDGDTTKVISKVNNSNDKRKSEHVKVVKSFQNEEEQQLYQQQKIERKKEIKKVKAKQKKTNISMTVLLVAVIITSVFAIIMLMLLNSGFKDNKKQNPLPNCLGITVDECKVLLSEVQLGINSSNIEYVLNDSLSEGLIISTSIDHGTLMNPNEKIGIVVSSGIYLVMDDYVGMEINDAKKAVNDKYSNVRVLVVEAESDQKAGTVIKQDLLEPQAKFSPKVAQDIRLTIASYPSVVIPHSIIGMDIYEAQQYLESLEIVVILSLLESTPESVVDTGVVIRCTPDTGVSYTQEDGNYVTLYYY